MQERLHQQQATAEVMGECVLFFGCRRSDQDYLYGPQLEQWRQESHLTLFTAFSRQQVFNDSHRIHTKYCRTRTIGATFIKLGQK